MPSQQQQSATNAAKPSFTQQLQNMFKAKAGEPAANVEPAAEPEVQASGLSEHQRALDEINRYLSSFNIQITSGGKFCGC